jgi:transcriptional regulator GlxA family with amidase domain
MKQITLLAIEGSNLGSLDHPRRAFLTVNSWLQQHHQPAAFIVKTIGLHTSVQLDQGLYSIHPEVLIHEPHHADLIIIPAFGGDIADTLQRNHAFIPWLIAQHAAGAEIASLCLGTFLLAATGLLDNKLCVTHWQAIPLFRNLFPRVRVTTDRILTDEAGLYTGGGAFSSANLMVYLIEKYAGHEAAMHCARVFQIDLNRQSQSPFMIFHPQKNHADEAVRQAQEYIEQHYAQPITVSQLCQLLALSRRSFERRFKQATGFTVGGYIQRVRMEAAKKKLESEATLVNEVMYAVGYQDHKAFREAFKKITGLSPLQYRNRYGKDWYRSAHDPMMDHELN